DTLFTKINGALLDPQGSCTVSSAWTSGVLTASCPLLTPFAHGSWRTRPTGGKEPVMNPLGQDISLPVLSLPSPPYQ
ncbi:hypothetical protein BaRGS_00000723, partial [Batillaria attramentaria]